MGLKKVASAEGARRYKLPIGSVIGKGGLGSRGVGSSLVGKRSNGRIQIGRTAKAHLDGIRQSQKPDPKDLPKKDTGGKRSAAEHLKRLKSGMYSSSAQDSNPYVPKTPGEGESNKHVAMTNEEYKAHTARIEKEVVSTFKTKSTHLAHSTTVKDPVTGEKTITWSAERAKLHREIVDQIWKESNADRVPNEGKAVIAGGLGGAGKTTVLKQHAGVNMGVDYVVANPDDVKEVMAKRGLAPKIEGMSPMETSALLHEESSAIAQLVANRAYAERKNLIWDITMASESSTKARIDALKQNGYTDIEAVFVEIPVEKSVERALQRHRNGMERYRAGNGLGGRYVPPSIIRENIDPTGKFSSKNKETFEHLKPLFSSWGLWNNSGKSSELQKVDGTGRWEGGNN